ncbi:hypothetical protein D3C71_674430 [compost metagenome]
MRLFWADLDEFLKNEAMFKIKIPILLSLNRFNKTRNLMIMKPSLFLISILLFHVVSQAQETITYEHCNCVDIIETLAPKPNGKYTRKCNNQVIETGNFTNGQKDGEWKSYSTQGTLIKVIHYSNGILEGDVLFNYSSGHKKLSGNFSKGLKNGYWAFFSQKDKLQWDVTYDQGTPKGNAQFYDRKGKNVVISFNFESGSYTKKDPAFSLFDEESGVLQEATSTEWFVLFIPGPSENTIKAGLNQKNADSQLLMSMLEIPNEYFNTYFKAQYDISISFENYGVNALEVKRESKSFEDYPVFAFAVMTNDPEKLHKIQPNELSLLLLDSKIKEAFSMIQPWQIKTGDFHLKFIYILNELDGREVLDQD